MATAPNPPQTGPIDQRIEDLRAALWQARAAQVVLGVLIAAVAIVFLYSLFAEPSIRIDKEKLVAEMKKRMAANSDTILEEVTSFGAETLPPVANAFAEQATQDMPLYVSALDDQSDELMAGLEQQLRGKLKAQSKEYLAEHRRVFREVFPEITEDHTIDAIVRDFRETAERLAERYYLDEFRKQAKRTAKLWMSIKPVEPPRQGTLEDQLLEYTTDWAALKAIAPVEHAAHGNWR